MMARNLDLTALRSFVAVADTGGVTRAAGAINLTQSAVSMQIKRLEEALGLALFDRAGRGVRLTLQGEQLLGYARRMLALNDEALARLTAADYEGELILGVPHDVIYPNVPGILKRFAAEYPRVKVQLISSSTRSLRAMLDRGECHLILTTEDAPAPGGEGLVELPLTWMGAEGGHAWRQRPLPIAFCSNCIFRPGVVRALETSGLDWDMVVNSEVDPAIFAAVSADLAVTAALRDARPPGSEEIDHGGTLPELGTTWICLYQLNPEDALSAALAEIVRETFLRSAGAAERAPVRMRA